VAAVDWQNPLVKEGKQAEFLMLDSFEWGDSILNSDAEISKASPEFSRNK